jgi:hypothetical protein
MAEKWIEEAERQLKKAKPKKVFESRRWREKTGDLIGEAEPEEGDTDESDDVET